MFLIIFLISAAAAVLCALTAKSRQKLRCLMVLLCILTAAPAVIAGLILCGCGNIVSYPGNPKAVTTAFFSELHKPDYPAADRLLLGPTRFDTDTLSDDALTLTRTLSDSSKVTPLGDPVYDGLIATQSVLVTRIDTQALHSHLYNAAYDILSDMMLTREKEALFNADASAYLPGVKEEAYALGLTAALETIRERTVTERVDVRLLWTPFGWYILPDTDLLKTVTGYSSPAMLDAALTDIRSDVLAELPLLKKVYVLDENITAAPSPDPDGFHSTTDPQEVVSVIERASALLDGQTMSWSPDIELLPGSEIRYYYDDSILVIIWQEVLDNCIVTFSEVKLAHASQLFRTLCGGAYQSSSNPRFWEKPSAMAQRANAVIAVTGDFYRNRTIGTVVYQGNIYRNDPNALDTCLFDSSGDMHFVRRKTLDKDQLTEYVADNDIRFSVSFGPVLIEDGVKNKIGGYPVGENNGRYDRCALGQLDELHYLFLTANFNSKYRTAALLVQAQNYLYDKGCVQGYTLDGGQTGTIVFNGQVINRVNYGGERTSSDILCFASALPDHN